MMMNNHLKRIYTGISLVALTVLSVIYLPSAILALLFLGITILFALEWTRLTNTNRSAYVLDITAVLAICALLWLRNDIYSILLIACALWWGVMLVISTFFHQSLCRNHLLRIALRCHLLITLPVAWFSLFTLHNDTHSVWLLYVIGLVVACDVGAYYSGKRFGKTSLCPDISSGKTRAGVGGALITSLIIALVMDYLVSVFQHDATNIYHLFSLPDFIMLSLFLCLISILGDLVASMAKRCANVKDSGNLLPGHGGIVDRLDSLVATVPFFILAWRYL